MGIWPNDSLSLFIQAADPGMRKSVVEPMNSVMGGPGGNRVSAAVLLSAAVLYS